MRSGNGGMLYMSLISLGLFSLAGAGQGWFDVAQSHISNTSLKVASFLHPVIFTFLLFILVAGSVVIRFGRPNGIRAFSFTLLAHLLLSLAGGIFILVTVFKQPPLPAECNNPFKYETETQCQQNRMMMPNQGLVSLYVLTWLLEGYLAFHAYHYQKTLRTSDLVSDLLVRTAFAAGPLPGTVITEPKAAYPFLHPTAAHGPQPGRF
ncbi:hypothetical protein BDN72DRAFT_849314 [Pluteus cervinus]|uniref:Uncharacterized protein n=1 Tax=Pluteus cervinus TaxID=181527 RepID=A0ACD3A8A7_9AGAR|nr:hypothetical protein BDN72DRAFT_849314 [Pluteus cervinus]